jgi:hypothetical protein
MNTTKNADKRLISYAVDLGTRIGTLEGTSNQHILEVHANRGVVTTKSSSLSTKTYTIHNVDARAKTLIIEQPIRPSFTPVSPKPTETTATAHRYEVKLAAGATEKVPVVEEYVFWQSTQVASFTPDLLVEYVSQKAISETGRAQLQRIIDQKARIAETDAALRTTHAEMDQITQAQDRLRQNIQTLNNVNGQQDQVQKWSQQLGAEEVRITALRDQASGLEKQKTAQQAELSDMIGKLEF